MKNIELEDRILINKDSYINLMNHFNGEGISIINNNHYFDTQNFDLLNSHIVLRIREVENRYELTLKIKGENGDIEVNQIIDSSILFNMKQNGTLPNGEIKEMLEEKNSNSKIKYITNLKTERYEIKRDKYLVVIDKNKYNNIEDYNLEVESEISLTHAKSVLKDICKKFSIIYQSNCKSKSRRAFESLKIVL